MFSLITLRRSRKMIKENINHAKINFNKINELRFACALKLWVYFK